MPDLTKTLPASWYTSPGVYQLERRGVFLKSWYFLGPVTRFVNSPSVSYEIAQITLTVVNLSPGQNLPEQREELYKALRVTQPSPESETGTTMRSHVTSSGLLFVALSDAAPTFDDYFPDIEPLISRVDFTTLPYRHSISYPGNFNWKTMVDGYQECLHCQYTHPSFSKFYPPTFYAVHNHKNFSQHIADPNKPNDGLFLYFFPNCTLNVYGGGMSSFRVCPTADPGVTRMEFDYYHRKEGDDFKEYFRFVRQVAEEDFELCERAQGNLQRGVYERGILNPVKEGGVIYYQQRVRDFVLEQFKDEQEKARMPEKEKEEKNEDQKLREDEEEEEIPVTQEQEKESFKDDEMGNMMRGRGRGRGGKEEEGEEEEEAELLDTSAVNGDVRVGDGVGVHAAVVEVSTQA